MPGAAAIFVLRGVASDQFDFAVLPAGLFHLPDGVMRPQISLRALPQLAVKSLIVGIEVCYQAFRQRRSGQTFGDDKGIVPERFKEFAQHLGLLGVLRHALHLSLQLLSTKRLLPIILQCFRVAQIVFNFFSSSAGGIASSNEGFWIGALFRPNPVAPVLFLNRSLINDTISQSQHCASLLDLVRPPN